MRDAAFVYEGGVFLRLGIKIMGMFDYIKCKMNLPDSPPSFVTPDYQFQTKDLECMMETYEIDANGKIEGLEDWTGEISFYNDNGAVWSDGLIFTRDGRDYESVEYKATVINGVVTDIAEVEKERKPALSRSVLDEVDKKFGNIEQPDIDMSEPEIGQKMWLQHGGADKGREITIKLKSENQVAYIDERGNIQSEYLSHLGHLLFHSKADCEKVKSHDKAVQRQKAEYLQNLISEKCS